jgi:hypothetical protein
VKIGMAASLWLIMTLGVVGTSVAQNASRIPYSGVRCPDSELLKKYIGYIQGGLDPEHAVAKVTACRLGEIEPSSTCSLLTLLLTLMGRTRFTRRS